MDKDSVSNLGIAQQTAAELLATGNIEKKEIAETVGVSRITLYNCQGGFLLFNPLIGKEH